ncbi:hypothetical protein WJX77_005831 [Trebouxia sp. C0004]
MLCSGITAYQGCASSLLRAHVSEYPVAPQVGQQQSHVPQVQQVVAKLMQQQASKLQISVKTEKQDVVTTCATKPVMLRLASDV